ncbi:ABC transporter substrate-binding protein [Vibrio nitrifigilis]|uniref:Iron-siderophore ABC transporter substrate-binding protein n=1 Tax=Vibrio nitrifigilis TaxID=2789781 RepID=A0ABS0G9I8_9VIBR|nr:iron-siderophore ABC transporter substrate-binding protein [Vibrio nitrifigilis]MBF8999035.1 iron-siderophore ABC transporter substrate-binding protein [Vibrio nitrifigilis]
MMTFKQLIQSALLVGSMASFCANAFEVKDAKGTHEWQQPAKRVVVLNWSAAEAMFTLGVTPVGMADPNGYDDWVKLPKRPTNMTNIGMRGEPNLERIHQLKPDVIISGAEQGSAYQSLAQISPVLSFDTFRVDHQNGPAVDQAFLNMAKAVGKEPEAKAFLAQRTKKIAQWREQLEAHFNHHIPKVVMVHFSDTSHVSAYGKNSTIEYALSQLGIKPALPSKQTAWGMTTLPLQRLAQVNEGVVIYIRPFTQEKKLFSSVLWQHLPFVNKGHFLTVEPCWTYGSAESVEHIAQAATQALLTLPKS